MHSASSFSVGAVYPEPLVSVIVPVYNTPAAFLDECVVSVLRQAYRNLELVLIDDGSRADVAAICDKLAAADDRCRVLHQENGGVSSARNAGMSQARGEYLMFVDADDVIPAGVFERMVPIAECDELDLLCGAYRKFDAQGCKDHMFEGCNAGSYELLEGERCIHFSRYVLSHRHRGTIPNKVFRGMAAKLFRRAAVAGLSFDPRIPIMEDSMFVSEAAARSRRIGLLNEVVYGYRENPASAMHGMDAGPWIDEEAEAIYEHAAALGLPESDVDSMLCELFLYVYSCFAGSVRERVGFAARLRGRRCFERAFGGMTDDFGGVNARKRLKLQLIQHRCWAGLAAYEWARTVHGTLSDGCDRRAR